MGAATLENRSLTTQLTQVREENTSLLLKITTLESTVGELKTDVTETESEQNDILSKLGEIQRTSMETDAALEARTKELEVVVGEKDAAEAKVLELETKVAELETIIAELDLAKHKLEETIQDQEATSKTQLGEHSG